MSADKPLPPRRPSVNRDLVWPPEAKPGEPVHRFELGVGCYADGRPGEVFCVGLKEGSVLQQILDDFCVLVSRLRQKRGLTFAEMSELARADLDPVSPTGLVLRELARMERENGQ
jgi:hypothetical protein